MNEEIEFSDIFGGETDIESLKNTLNTLIQRFGIHTHDGRNSLEIDFLRSKDKIRLLSLFPLSDKSDGNVTISGTTTLTRDMFYDRLTIENGGILQPVSAEIIAAAMGKS